jgi:hypothetical protein
MSDQASMRVVHVPRNLHACAALMVHIRPPAGGSFDNNIREAHGPWSSHETDCTFREQDSSGCATHTEQRQGDLWT